MSEAKPTLAEILNANKGFVMALLSMPIIGMVIAAALLIYKKPDNLIVILGVILFIGIQYTIMIFFFMKRIERLVMKEKEEPAIPEVVEEEPLEEESEQLAPEEERVFPLKDEKE